jgi:hypothetical protein
MSKKLYFILRNANWQHYRNEVLTHLANKHDYQVETLTTDQLKPYLHENDRLKYKIFKNVFSDEAKKSFFPGTLSYKFKNRPGNFPGLNNGTQLTKYISILLCKLAGIKFIAWTHADDHKPIINPLIHMESSSLLNYEICKATKSNPLGWYSPTFMVKAPSSLVSGSFKLSKSISLETKIKILSTL